MTKPICPTCNTKRRLVAVEPIVEGYEIRSYECTSCKVLIRLVESIELPTILVTMARPQRGLT